MCDQTQRTQLTALKSDHRFSLPFWGGFIASKLELQNSAIWITLRRDPAAAMVCGGCGAHCYQVHDAVTRLIRELPMQGKPVWLQVPLRRLKCDACGTRTERVTWLGRHARVTRALADFVGAWCEKLPVAHVCKLSGLHWGTVRQIERARLERQLVALPPAQPTWLVMDEFALFKGHRYATVVLDADGRQVLWVGEGRSRDAIRPFFEWLGPVRCVQIVAVALDMNTAFDLEVQWHCPSARVIYDLFHVIAKYGREGIDRVRVDEANRLRHERPQRQVVKRARWLLLRNPENVPPEQQTALRELLTANQALLG